MDFTIKFAFDILAFTSVMVLIVLGLGVIASMMGIFNFAHGELVLLGAYTVYLSDEYGLGTWSGVIAAPIVVGLVGLVLERTIIKRFYAVPADHRYARHLCHRADYPRDRTRIVGWALQVDSGADQRCLQRGWSRFFQLAHVCHRTVETIRKTYRHETPRTFDALINVSSHTLNPMKGHNWR